MSSAYFRLIALIACSSLLLLAACGGGDGASDGEIPAVGAAGGSPTPSKGTPGAATATATPKPPLDECPFERSLCQFTAAFETALAKGDSAAVVSFLLLRTVECTGRPAQGIEPEAGLCEGKPAGSKVEGYLLGRRSSEAGYVTADSVRFTVESLAVLQVASAQDDFGFGGMRQTTVASAPTASCPTCHRVIFTYILTPASGRFSREVVEIEAAKSGDNWVANNLFNGILFRQEAKAILTGGAYEGRDYKVWSQVTGAKVVGTPGIFLGLATTVSKTTFDCLNVRETPTTASRILTCRPPGTPVAVYSGPIIADDVRWWFVEIVGLAPPIFGWVSGEFLER